MKALETPIPEVVIFSPDLLKDQRGFFLESYRKSWLPNYDFVQENHSHSIGGTLRGLHYQLKHPQGKLVRVTKGEIFDVAVDLRQSSKTFGKWTAKILSEENKDLLWIPPGFAHGFLVLSDKADLVYKCTEYYCPEDENSIRWDDRDLAIDWPLKGNSPILSQKDEQAPSLKKSRFFP